MWITGLCFVSFPRPFATGLTQIRGIAITPTNATQAQLRSFKHGIGRNRLTFSIPLPHHRRISTLLFRAQNDSRKEGKAEDWHIFGSRNAPASPLTSADASAVMHAILKRLSCKPPLGCKRAAKETRSGAVSAAFSVGVDIEAIRWMRGSKSIDVLRHHCLDPRAQQPQAAEKFFGHLRHSAKRHLRSLGKSFLPRLKYVSVPSNLGYFTSSDHNDKRVKTAKGARAASVQPCLLFSPTDPLLPASYIFCSQETYSWFQLPKAQNSQSIKITLFLANISSSVSNTYHTPQAATCFTFRVILWRTPAIARNALTLDARALVPFVLLMRLFYWRPLRGVCETKSDA